VEYVGIDWSYRRAAWCALSDAGKIVGEDASQFCLGKLPLLSGRLTALHGIEKPRQLSRTLCEDLVVLW
jgi:hypothetical protein